MTNLETPYTTGRDTQLGHPVYMYTCLKCISIFQACSTEDESCGVVGAVPDDPPICREDTSR